MTDTVIQHPDGTFRLPDGRWMPDDMRNTDRQELERQIVAGETVVEDAPPPAPPANLVDEELAAIRKAVLTGEKADLQAIDDRRNTPRVGGR